MSSRRPPLAVYSAKRRQRSISNPHAHAIPASSPIKQLSEQDTDLTVDEMSRRMMKRSRSSLKRSHSGPDPAKAASVGASPNDLPLEEARPAKKSRTGTRAPLTTITEPGQNVQSMPVGEEGTMDMDLTSMAEVKTPAPRVDGTIQAKPDDAEKNEESDFLSPLPTSHSAKRVVAHRSSSDLRGNETKNTAASSHNMLLSPAPNDLASPFSSRPASPNSTRAAVKKNFNKKLNRTRSVGTDLRRKATTRSFSRAVSPASSAPSPHFHRHPSLPSSQSSKKKENQDWFVPAKLEQPVRQRTPRKLAEHNTSFVRESSFFNTAPEACSTPVPSKQASTNAPPPTPGFVRDTDATPRPPLALRNATIWSNAWMTNEPTPRALPTRASPMPTFLRTEDSLFPDTLLSSADPTESVSQAAPPPRQKERRRMTLHLSQDSIFSSALDFSTTVTIRESIGAVSVATNESRMLSESVMMAPPSSPTAAPASPATSDGDELRDMFSILGLDENDQWFTSSIVASDTSRASATSDSRAKKIRSTSTRSRSSKQGLVNNKRRVSHSNTAVPASSISRALGPRKRGTGNHLPFPSRAVNKKTSRQSKLRPTIKMKILEEPIQPTTDSSDELDFLKSHGTPLSDTAHQ